MLRCTVNPIKGEPRFWRIFTGLNSVDARVDWDDTFEMVPDESFVLLPICTLEWAQTQSPDLYSLLLKPTGNERGQYERVGSNYTRRGVEKHLFLQGLSQKTVTSEEALRLLPEADYLSVDVDEENTKWYTITII
jgi:hypothetical protein